jgi:hypothetical protein
VRPANTDVDMMRFFPRYFLQLIIISIGAALFLFVFTKARCSSFTHDESFSFLHYCHESFMNIISFSDFYTNNHILNSLFMKFTGQLFGNSELALRLPNLILMIVYMYYSYRLMRSGSFLFTLMAFILLCTNATLMDFFGLARGYGLSWGFMMMSLYHFMASLKEKKKADIYLFHLGALLAILSNFTLIAFYLALMLVYNIVLMVRARFGNEVSFNFFQVNKVHLLPLLFAGIVLYEPLRRLLTYSELDFGGKTGFYADTLSFVIWSMFDYIAISDAVLVVLKILVTVLVALPFFIIVWSAFRNKKEFFEQHEGLVIMTFIMISIPIIIILQHIFLNVDYPVSRFSAFLLPLFLVHFVFLMRYFIEIGYRSTGLVIITGAAIASLAGFIQKANLSYASEWAYDSETKNMIEVLALDHEKNVEGQKTVKLGINWLFEPTVNFYRLTRNLDWLLPADREGFHQGKDDYFYIFETELEKLQGHDYEIMRKFEGAPTVLIRNKSKR